MKAFGRFGRLGRTASSRYRNVTFYSKCLPSSNATQNQARRRFHVGQRKGVNEGSNPADNPDFLSVVDQPNRIVSTRQKHGPGLIILALIPITAFALGTWQVKRLNRKTDMISKYEDRLVRPPLPLPPRIDPSVIEDFDYRPVYAVGRFRHDQEMLIGPRIQNGENGYLVITPLEREGSGSTILVNRGWISKKMANQQKRPDGLPQGEVTVSGLLRKPFKKNMFTPDNRPETGDFYFPDVEEMARLTGSQPVWMEETMIPDYTASLDRIDCGMPVGRPAEVNLSNNHLQYIFTWYSLSIATTYMFWLLVRRAPGSVANRVRTSRQW